MFIRSGTGSGGRGRVGDGGGGAKVSEIFSIYRLESELPENVCNFFNIGFFFFFFQNIGPFGVSNV